MAIKKLVSKKVQNQGIKPEKIDGYTTFTKKKGKDFKILQLTDLHFGCGLISWRHKTDIMANNAIIKVVEEAKPDLIIVTGDLAYPIPIHSGTINNMRPTKKAGKLLDSFGIPWTLVYGNHDEEPFATHSKKRLTKYYQSLNNCLLEEGPKDVTGDSNHIIKLLNEDKSINTALMMLDSNMYVTKSFFSGFDNIHDDQIEWYKNEINKMSTKDKKVQSLAFFHIPFLEYKEAWRKFCKGDCEEVQYHCGEVGETNDYFGTPKTRGKFFDEMVKFQSLKGCFCGHDHYNNVSMTYKGIRLTYGMSIDYLAYRGVRKYSSQRGGTIININDKGEFSISLLPLDSLK